jgi:thiol-disulfide isomerase/thioredoxin
MKRKTFLFALMIASYTIFAQNYKLSKNLVNEYGNNTIPEVKTKTIAPDFTVTFTDGTVANLYNTLNAGNIVMLDFFTTTCSYCEAYAPTIEQSYINHGAGQGNIKYWGIDPDYDQTDADVIAYKSIYGVTNPCASGVEGGGDDASLPYILNFNYVSCPVYSVVCPDKTISWNINNPPAVNGFDSYFAGCGSTSINENNNTLSKFTGVYPNPATEKTTFDFYLDKVSSITIDVYNITGEKVFSFSKQNVNAGYNYFELQVNNFANGMYFIKLTQENTLVDITKLSVSK